MAKRGRPRIELDLDQLRKLAEKQWSDQMIASFFEISVDTLHDNYSDKIQQYKQGGKGKLVDLQWKRVLEGSDRVLLHMSKHYLGQHDKVEVDQKTEIISEVVESSDGSRSIELKARLKRDGDDSL